LTSQEGQNEGAPNRDVTKEANTIALKDSINKLNAAMIAAVSKSKNGKDKINQEQKPKLTAQIPIATKMGTPSNNVMQWVEKGKNMPWND